MSDIILKVVSYDYLNSLQTNANYLIPKLFYNVVLVKLSPWWTIPRFLRQCSVEQIIPMMNHSLIPETIQCWTNYDHDEQSLNSWDKAVFDKLSPYWTIPKFLRQCSVEQFIPNTIPKFLRQCSVGQIIPIMYHS